jgi:hypothetical protein
MSVGQVWTWLCNCFKFEQDRQYNPIVKKTFHNFSINLQWQIPLKIQYLSHLRFWNYKITSKKSHSLRISSNTKSLLEIFKKILLFFIEFLFTKNFNIDSYIIGLKIMKPPQCTPIHQGFSIGIKNTRKNKIVWEISMWQTNKLSSLIYRCPNLS